LLHQVLPERLRERNAGYKLHKLAEVMQADNEESVYLGLISHWADPASLIRGGGPPPDVLGKCRMGMAFDDFTRQMMYTDTVTYLPDDILVKVDRASMGISLEARVPLLDHRLLEFAWRLPMHMKIRGGQGKWLLRQVLYKYVPKTFFDRPKMGFAVPLDSWLRGPLREWAEALLAEKRLNEEGFFQQDPIREKWAEHLSGRRDWQYHLWDILMFQAWLDESKQAAAGMSCQA
jgi:asparagine synthase (glutamine-hydrolysing)